MIKTTREAARARHNETYPGMFSVCISYDGCINEPPVFEGTNFDCLSYMRSHRAPRLCEWDLVSKQSGRCVSFML